MAALVAVEAVAIVLLGLLVVGLLRSHADILRQLHELGAGRDDTPTGPVLEGGAPGAATGAAAHDVAGQTPGGEAAVVAVAGAQHDTVLAFLSSSCLTCAGFWDALAGTGDLGLPARTRVVAVTKGPGDESEAAVAKLAPAGRTVVMSTEAWLDYQVPGSPYFVHVSGASDRVVGEGTAASWPQVVSLVTRANEDRLAAGRDRRDRADGAPGGRIDEELLAAGIRPGDPRLYPTAPLSSDEP